MRTSFENRATRNHCASDHTCNIRCQCRIRRPGVTRAKRVTTHALRACDLFLTRFHTNDDGDFPSLKSNIAEIMKGKLDHFMQGRSFLSSLSPSWSPCMGVSISTNTNHARRIFLSSGIAYKLCSLRAARHTTPGTQRARCSNSSHQCRTCIPLLGP